MTLQTFISFSEKRWYWLGFFILGMSFELIALYYQYFLDYMPCVLCIHVRIIMLGVIILSILALLLIKQRFALSLINLLMTALMIGLLERSYQLLGVERGFIMGDCSMNSGLPAWFALDKWLPSVFKVWEPCGYTPEILFGVTMAEALMFISILLILTTVWVLFSPVLAQVLFRKN